MRGVVELSFVEEAQALSKLRSAVRHFLTSHESAATIEASSNGSKDARINAKIARSLANDSLEQMRKALGETGER